MQQTTLSYNLYITIKITETSELKFLNDFF